MRVLKDDVPLKLKEKSNSFEQDISKKLYKDFSNFRTLLFENIVKNNLGNETLIPSVLNGEVEPPSKPTNTSSLNTKTMRPYYFLYYLQKIEIYLDQI